MMNLSRIGWCDFSWNPVTGCQTSCSFCYGKHQATRLCGTIRINLGSPQIQRGPQKGLYILPQPFHNDSGKVIAYPAGFAPKHRLLSYKNKRLPHDKIRHAADVCDNIDSYSICTVSSGQGP